MPRRGARAAVGASLRLRRSRSAARAREASGREELGRRLVSSIGGRPHSAVDSMSWRSRKNRDITQLELELEADAAEGIAHKPSQAPARGTHPGAPANRSRRSRAARAAAAERPATAPNVSVLRTTPSLEPLGEPEQSAEDDRRERHSMGWNKAPLVQQRRARQELLEAVEQGAATQVEVLLRFGTPVRGTHDTRSDE